MHKGFELEAINITVCRKGKLIVHDVSFRVQPSTLTAIIGPNGAGKTTLMRALSGERPDRGQVLINGQDLYAEPEYWLQRIGYVPDHNILHEHLTLQDALMYIGRLRLPEAPIEQIKAKVDKVLSEFGFPKGDARRRKLIKKLSSGERKRANVCSELIIDPPILMLDEPTSGLDPDAEWNLMKSLAQYAHNHGQTILVITHTLNTIHFCDEVIFLENGRKRAAGTHVEVLEALERGDIETQSDTGSACDVSVAEVAPETDIGQTQSHKPLFSRWARVFGKYKTDEDKRKDCSFLFTVGAKYQGDLEQRALSENLRQEFEDHAISLSDRVSIRVEKEGRRWRIKDQDLVYDVHLEGDKLNIYNCSRKLSKRDEVRTPSTSRQFRLAPWSYQLRHLLGRYMKARLGDKWSLIGTLLAGFSGVMFFILPGKAFIKPFDPAEIGVALNQARQSVYLVSLVVTLIGLITSYTEISREFRIYRHERLKGLSPSAYFVSKWIWLTAAVGILAPIVLESFIVLVYQQPLPDFPEPRIGETVRWLEQLVHFQFVGLLARKASWLFLTTLILTCIASVTLGLLVSAVAGDSGKGYLYLSFVVVFIVLFSGLIQNEKLDKLIDRLSFASTGKWAYDGIASSIGIYCWWDVWRFDEFNSIGHIVSIWLSLMAYILVAASLAIVMLRIRDPWYRPLMNLKRLLVRDWAHIAVSVSLLILLLSYAVFLRQRSYEYHSLTYYSVQKYGGTGAIEYAKIQEVANVNGLQLWNGRINQSWCGDQ